MPPSSFDIGFSLHPCPRELGAPQTDDTIAQTVLFLDLVSKPRIATFDQARVSSDGGSMLLKAADRSLGLTPALAQAMPDRRAAPWVK